MIEGHWIALVAEFMNSFFFNVNQICFNKEKSKELFNKYAQMTKMICLGILMLNMYAKNITIKKKKIHSMSRKYLKIKILIH